MGHTPGPWEVGGVGDSCVATPTHPDERICVCWDPRPAELEDGSWEDHSPEIRANARLIAAAPELLAVCQAIAGDLQALLDGDDFSGMSDAELFGVMLRSLNAAIGKAEGRSE